MKKHGFFSSFLILFYALGIVTPTHKIVNRDFGAF